MSEREIDEATGVQTTGHEWDGIKELDNPMPRWWLWTFYATIVWSIGYMIAYPAWPLINGATQGVLGWSSRADLRAEIDAASAAQAGRLAAIAELPLADIMADEELRRFAVAGGAAAYRVNCSQCHASGAEGSPGYPNLNDDAWIWGGDIDALYHTIAHGIRFAGDPETRFSQMPAYAGMLRPAEIRQVAAHVASLSGRGENATEEGAAIYAAQCASCHGASGEGDREIGAPNLADALWLYGSSEAEIAEQIRAPRHGVMPGWHARLGETTVKQLAIFVHSLGGGE